MIRGRIARLLLTITCALVAPPPVSAQVAPSMTVAPTAPLAIARPHYVTLAVELPVDRPAAAVWARIGGFCDIGEWLHVDCAIVEGADRRLGAVRRVGGGFIEMLVARTDLSYTYAQPVRVGVPYNAYHGTLEVKPLTASTSRIVYSFFYDNSTMADDAARAAEMQDRRHRFTVALATMKRLAEQDPGRTARRP